jgi:hypothetical protein
MNNLHGTRLVHVPYRGAAPAVADAVGGQVKLTISGMPPTLQFLQAGTLKAIAVTSRQRSPAFPNAPALAETAGFEDFDFTNWFGLLARTGTPQPILDKLAKAAVAALKDSDVREILKSQAAEPVGNAPAEFRDFIRAESAKYGKIVALRPSRFPATSRSCSSRPARPSSTAKKTSGSSCGRIGCQIASSNPSTTSSIIAATPGTRSSISRGKSCPSPAAIGPSSVTQYEDWYKASTQTFASYPTE